MKKSKELKFNLAGRKVAVAMVVSSDEIKALEEMLEKDREEKRAELIAKDITKQVLVFVGDECEKYKVGDIVDIDMTAGASYKPLEVNGVKYRVFRESDVVGYWK